MVLDGSKEASLPSCGDKPSLALQQRDTFDSTVEDFESDWLNQESLLGFCFGCPLPSPHQAV